MRIISIKLAKCREEIDAEDDFFHLGLCLDHLGQKWRAVMDYLTMKIVHLSGVFVLFVSLGATLLAGSGKVSAKMLHGIAMLVILLAGFAMLRKPPMDSYWWMAKAGIWVFIGIAPLLSRRKILPPSIVLLLTLGAAVGAAYLGIRKPF